MPVPGNTERKPYRLVRGSYSRRDGNEIPRRDENGKKTGGKAREFVRYCARTTENPNARDEIWLSPREAEALGKRVVPIVDGKVEKAAFDSDRVSEGMSLDQLILLGEAVTGTRSLNALREAVLKSGLIVGGKIPNKKHDILAMLRQIKTNIAREAAALGLAPIGGGADAERPE